MNYGQMTQKVHEVELRNAQQAVAVNDHQWNRQRREEAERENREHERQMEQVFSDLWESTGSQAFCCHLRGSLIGKFDSSSRHLMQPKFFDSDVASSPCGLRSIPDHMEGGSIVAGHIEQGYHLFLM